MFIVDKVAMYWKKISLSTVITREVNPWFQSFKGQAESLFRECCYWGLKCEITYHFENSRALSVQFSSVIQSCPTLCNLMNCSTPGLPVHHQFPEFTQTHVHRVGDAIQPPHPLDPFSSCPQSLPASESFPMQTSSCVE